MPEICLLRTGSEPAPKNLIKDIENCTMETKTEQMSVSGDASALKETAKSTVAKKESPERAEDASRAEKKPQTRRSTRSAGRRKSVATSEKATESASENLSKQTAQAPEAEQQNAASDPPVSSESTSVPAEQKKKSTARRATKAPAKSAEIQHAETESAEKTAEEAPAEKPKTAGTKKTSAKKTEKKVKKTEASEPVVESTVSEKTESTTSVTEIKTDETPSVEAKKSKVKTEKKPQRDAAKQTTDKPKKKTSPAKKTAVKSEDTKPSEEEKAEPEMKLAEASEQKSFRPSLEEMLEAMAKKAKKKPEPVVPDSVATETLLVEQLTAEIPEEVSEPLAAVAEPENAVEAERVLEPEPEIEINLQAEYEQALMPEMTVVHETAPGYETVDVSGSSPDTFFFISPSQLAQMEAEAAKRSETVPNPSDEKTDTLEAEAVEAAEKIEKPVAEAIAEIAAEAEEKEKEIFEPTVPEAGATRESVQETVFEEPKKERFERRSVSSRRSDPHEREVMDKEKVRANLFAVLGRSGELDRRVLIEETMKTIALTDEERLDNHPTSLSNRVRSVIGSVLAEELSHGTVIASGRKLTLPSAEPKHDAEEDDHELIEDPSTYTVHAASDPESAALEIEIEFGPVSAEEAVAFPEETQETTETAVPEEVAHVAAFEAAEEAPAAPSAEPGTREETVSSAREPSFRRVRQPRGERPQRSQTVATAVLITEEELERVILNAVRRNSATRNDLFALLKRTFVEPNRFSKDEENRIYAAANNVLQKLVNRGSLQNNDGRYLQKPSQRVLNPGRAPGASFTGNVEARFITELNRQSGDFFEQFAARLLEKYFEMSNIRVDASYVVGGSDDNGIDIMLETTDWLGYKERVFVQAKKRATQPVTLKEVREFYGALCAEEGTRGVFITTSGFCMEASKMIGKLRNLIAIDKRKLFALAEHCEVGLVRDEEGRLLLDENLFLDYDV